MRNWEEEESSNFCTKHKIDFYGSCPSCRPTGNGELVETLADIGSGLSPKSWDNYLEQQTQDAINQMDQDEQYIEEQVCL